MLIETIVIIIFTVIFNLVKGIYFQKLLHFKMLTKKLHKRIMVQCNMLRFFLVATDEQKIKEKERLENMLQVQIFENKSLECFITYSFNYVKLQIFSPKLASLLLNNYEKNLEIPVKQKFFFCQSLLFQKGIFFCQQSSRKKKKDILNESLNLMETVENKLPDILQAIHQSTKILLQSNQKRQIFNLSSYVEQLCTHSIGIIIFGNLLKIKQKNQTLNYSKLSQELMQTVKVVSQLSKSLFNQFRYKLLNQFDSLSFFLLSRQEKRYKQNILDQLDQMHFAIYEKIENRQDPDFICQDLLDFYLEMYFQQVFQKEEEPITYIEIKQQIFNMYLAMYEKTRKMIESVLFDLAKHEECRKQIKEEFFNYITSIDDLENFTNEDLQALTYCQAFIYESLRMTPPKRKIKRVVKSDFELEGIKIKKHYQISINLNILHNHPQYQAKIYEFNPNRWIIDQNKDNISSKQSSNLLQNNFLFIPFSQGHRGCIGNNLAIIVAQLAILYIICYFDIEMKNEEIYITPLQKQK